MPCVTWPAGHTTPSFVIHRVAVRILCGAGSFCLHPVSSIQSVDLHPLSKDMYYCVSPNAIRLIIYSRSSKLTHTVIEYCQLYFNKHMWTVSFKLTMSF